MDNTRKYYQAESCAYISQNTCPDYLRKAEGRIKEEKARVESYLNESTLPRVQELMDNEWILSHYKTLVHMENSGCAAMFEHDKVQSEGASLDFLAYTWDLGSLSTWPGSLPPLSPSPRVFHPPPPLSPSPLLSSRLLPLFPLPPSHLLLPSSPSLPSPAATQEAR